MAFSIRCTCGREIPLHAGQAGTQLHCECGLVLSVPSLGEIRQLQEEEPAAFQKVHPAEEAFDHHLPGQKPSPQVHLLTEAAELGRRIRAESLDHYVRAVMRTIDDVLAHLPDTPGMDFCAALAILPEGEVLVDVEFRPALLAPAPLADIKYRLESIPRPPVREGPVALLAYCLVKGGSNDLRDSFRHRLGSCFYIECPRRFAAVLHNSESTSPPQPLPRWQILWLKVRRFALLSRTALRRVWFKAFPAAPATKAQGNLHEGQYTLDEIAEQIRLCPQSGTLHGHRAEIYRSQGEFDLAIADFTRQIDLGNEVAQAHLARGICYRMAGNHEKALEDFNETVWRTPRWTHAIIARAWTFFALGNLDRALADATSAVELEPDEPNWLLARARLLATCSMFDKAMEDLNHALLLDPHHPEALFLRAHVYRDRPCTTEQIKADFEASLADFSAVLHLNPGHAESYSSRASVLMRLEDYAAALADCEKAIQLDSGCISAFLCRANIHAIENRLAQAMLDCNQALRVVPGYVEALSARGMVRTRLGLFREALSDFNQAVRQLPESPLLYLHRGNAYGTLEDHRAALDDFSEAIRLYPEFTPAYCSRAVAWLHVGEHSRAIEDCEAAIRCDAKYAPAHFLRARLLDQVGASGEAMISYNDAIRLAPDFAAAYAGRANVWVNTGDYDQAISDYRQAIHHEPAAGQMLGQLDEEYAVEAVVRGLAEAEPGRGNLFLAGFLAHFRSLDEALDRCEAAMEYLPPEEVLGVALQVLRQHHDEADPEVFQRIEAWFQRATGSQGRSVQLNLLLANFRELEGRYPEFCEIYGQLIEQPDVPAEQRALACNNLAYFLAISQEDVRRALELTERAMELIGPCPEFLDTRGVALHAAGRFDEAVDELRRSVGNNPTGLRLYHLARACRAAGDTESALEAWEEAHNQQELTLEQIPFYEQHQYHATAELLQKND